MTLQLILLNLCQLWVTHPKIWFYMPQNLVHLIFPLFLLLASLMELLSEQFRLMMPTLDKLILQVSKIINSNLWMLEAPQKFTYVWIDHSQQLRIKEVWLNSKIFQLIVILIGLSKMDHTAQLRKFLLSLHMKQIAHKFIMPPLYNFICLLLLIFIFIQLALMEHENGTLVFHIHHQL